MLSCLASTLHGCVSKHSLTLKTSQVLQHALSLVECPGNEDSRISMHRVEALPVKESDNGGLLQADGQPEAVSKVAGH